MSNIIQNIEIKSDYYQEINLTYKITTELHKKIFENNNENI